MSPFEGGALTLAILICVWAVGHLVEAIFTGRKVRRLRREMLAAERARVQEIRS